MSEQLTFIPASEAAKIVGVTPETIRNLCKAGTIRFQRREQFYYPCKEDIEQRARTIQEIHKIEHHIEEYKLKLLNEEQRIRDAYDDALARLEATQMFPDRIGHILQLLQANIRHFDAQITEREIQIMECILCGYNIPQTAEKLSLTRSRVSQIWERIIRKIELFPDEMVAKDKIIAEKDEIIAQKNQIISELQAKIALIETPKKTPTEEEKILLTPIELCGFSTRTTSALYYRKNIDTVGDLIQLTPSTLCGIRNFGKKSLDEVRDWLAAHNLSLKGDRVVEIE